MTELQERIKQIDNTTAEIEDKQQTEQERLVLDRVNLLYSKNAHFRAFIGDCLDLFTWAVHTNRKDDLSLYMAFVSKRMET